MKKLSLLLALILCVTIGGVYANWIYAGTKADTLHHHIANMALTDPSTTTKFGKYEVKTGDDTIKIKFDQKDQTPGQFDYEAILLFTGSMKVTFTPDAAFEGEPVAKYKLASEKVLVGDTTEVKYLGENVFAKYDTTTEVELNFTEMQDGTWTATINATDLASLIEINAFELDTETKYNAFAQVLSTIGRIGIEVIDYTTPSI